MSSSNKQFLRDDKIDGCPERKYAQLSKCCIGWTERFAYRHGQIFSLITRTFCRYSQRWFYDPVLHGSRIGTSSIQFGTFHTLLMITAHYDIRYSSVIGEGRS